MIFSKVQYMWSLLWFFYQAKMKESGMGLLNFVSNEEILSLIELTIRDEECDDRVKVALITALLDRDSKEARRIMAVTPY